jgi:uncharacterized protein YbbK (DUF523 family)
MNILISMCLLGIPCRYDGKALEHILPSEFIDSVENTLIPVCPEQLGGMTTPRASSEIIAGNGCDLLDKKCKIETINKQDVTDEFLKGAELALDLARKYKIEKFIGCSESPSCSCKKIHNGEFKGILKDGCGVTAALLSRNGIELVDSDDLLEKLNNKV